MRRGGGRVRVVCWVRACESGVEGELCGGSCGVCVGGGRGMYRLESSNLSSTVAVCVVYIWSVNVTCV